MISLKVVSKRSGDGSQISVNEVVLKEAVVVRVGLSKEQVKGMRRVGNDLVITAVSGEVVTVRDFFMSFDGNKSDLVLDDKKGGLWLAGFGEGQGELALSYSGIDAIEPLLLQQDFNFGVLPWLVGGGLAAIGVASGGGGGGGGGSQMPRMPVTQLAAPADSLPPGRPTVNPTNARTITGTAEPGTTIRVVDNTGKEIGSATVAADGSYVVRPATPPAHGTELRVVAVDSAGNVSPEARTTVDSTAPAVPTVNPTSGNVVAGTAEPGSVVTVTDGRGNIIGSTTAGQDGSYRITPPAQLADRTAINVVATDAVGNASVPATTTVDRTAPAQPVVNPTNGNLITGTAEPGALVTVKDSTGKVIGSATAGPSGAYSVTPTTPPANGASISVVATDPAGNASQPATATIDAIAPATPKVNPTDGSPITGTAEPGSVVTVADDKGALIGSTTTGTNGVYSFTPAKPPANGVVIKVTASDAAGNTSKPATAIVDGTPPTPTVNLTKGSPITGTSEPDSVVTVSDSKGNIIGSTITAPDGTYSLVPATPPADGTVIHVVAKDLAGNVGRPATTIVDSRPPDAPVVSATNGSAVAGTAEANSVVTIKDATGKFIGSTTADATGKFGITPATPLANGTTLRVTAADAVGNVSPETSTTVDSVPPLAPTVDPTHGDPITGRAEPGSVVTVKDLAGNVIGSATTGSNGVYSLTPRKLPTDGAVLRVAATDAAGNTGPETRATVDGLPPARPTVNPTAGSSITGRAEAGSLVTVRDDTGKLIGSATTDASGNYSITPSVPPANGTGLRIIATDPAGNDSPEVKATIDSLPPATPTLNPSSGRLIAGSAEPGSVVMIRDGAGKLIGSTTADAAGKFSFTPTTPPADGTQISAVATDPAGNASQPGTTTIDSSAPIAPVINPTDGSPITGTAEPGSVVTVKDDTGKLIGSTTADTSGKFSITPVAPVANGTVITAVATDPAGNTGAPGSITVDSMAPAKPAIDVTNGSLITGTAEPRAIVTVKDAAGNLVGSAATDVNGRYSIKPAAVPPHNTVLRAVATDAAGNTSPEARATVDSDLPAVPQVDPTAGGAITGTAEPGSTVTVKDDAGKLIGSTTADANGKFSIKPATPSAHGTALDVTATDAARNTSQPARVTVDGKAPDAPIVNPSNGGTIAGTAEANSVVTIKDDTGRLLGSTTADANGRFSISPATPPANGTTITAMATDAAGNASAPGSTTVDSTPPLKPTVDATNGSLITGTAEPRSIVTIRDGAGNLVGSAAADVNGRYSIKPATAPSHNTVLRAVATDAAGNTGPEARATVDSDLPSVPKVDPTAGGSITGTAEPGSVVTIKDGAGKLIGSTAADANGKFGIKPATPLAHDTELSVTAADAAGNTSQPASVKVDGKAPDAPTVKPTNGSTITGTAEAGSVVTVKDGAGNLIGSTTADTSGAYRIDPATPPANGTTLEVTATDAAGNTGPRATAMVDGVPPQEPSIDPTNGNLISGIAEPGSVVTVRDGLGNVIGSTTAAASNGAYSIKPATVLADGTMLRAVATDAAGNASSEAKATVDSVVPLAPTVSPTNGSHVEGTAEAGSVVTVKDDAGNLVGSAIVAPNGTYSVTPSTQPAHGAVLHVTATDAAGNTSPEARATVDRTALPPPTVNPTDGSPITGRADPGSVVTVKDDAGKLVGSAVTAPNGTYSITPAVTPAHDTVLHVVATNAAGTASPEATARVDSVAPLEPTIKPSNGSQITGTAEAGAVVKVTDDADRLVGSAIAAPNGTYTIKPSAIPAHGTVLRAVATDAAGNTSPEARAVVDRVLPPAPKIDPTQGGLITGTAERGSVVTVVDDTGRLVGSTTADANGAYSIRPAATLPNGTVLRATATDAAGNASPEGRTTVDSALPAAPTVKPTNGGTIAGTAEPGSTVTVKDKAGNLIGTATADAGGNYAVKPAVVPANGTALEVTATDAAGNTGPAATATVDGKAPDAPTIDPTHGDPITGSAEPGSVVTVKDGTGRLIGSATVGINGAYAVTPVKPLGDGEKISVVATDLAGNASAPATATVDGVAPNRPTVEPTNGGTITGTAERGSVVTIKDSAGNTIGSATADANGNYAVKPATPPAHGTTLSVAATDAAGNTGPAATVSVDSSAPAAPTVKPTNGNTITGTAESGSTVTVKDSAGNVIGSATADAAGNYTVRPVTAPVHDAVLEVTARDAAGNTGPAASTKVDGKAPDAPTVAPTHGDVVKGQAEPGAIVTVRDGSGNVLGSATAGANGAYAVTPTRPLQDGMKISVVASDAAGNASAPGTATVDADAPLKPTVNPTNGNLISGTAEGGSVVTITDDTGRLIGSTTAAPGGTYSFRPATPPVHGTVLRVAATDAAGNTSPEAKATVDAVSPAAPVVNPTNGNTISGTAQPGSTVTVKDSVGALIGSTTADASGNYAIKPAVPPAHGTVLEVTSGDTAGNVSQPATVTVDSKAPNAPSIDPTHGDPITGRAEPGSVVTVKDGAGKLVGSATAGANGAYAITPAKPLDDGVKITAVATDAAGNASAPASATVDAVPPGRPTVSATNGSTISGTAEAGSIVTIKDSAGNLIGSTTALPGGTYSLTPATRPANGTELRVSAADAAGNTSPEAKATVDSAAPAAPTVKPTSGSIITGTAEAGSTVTVRDSAGNLVGSAIADAGGNYTVRPVSAVKHDTALEVTATDAAGNSGPAASVTVDSKAPDAPTVKPTSGSTIAGTAEAGSVVTVRDSAGNLIGSTTAGSNGEYSLMPAAPVPNGTQLRVVATDATGNASQPVTATVDSVAPVIAVAIVNDANNDGFINASEKKADVTVKVTLVSGAAVGDDISLTDGTHMASVKLTAADVANGFVDVSFPNPVEGASIRVSAISQDLAGNASRPTVFDSAVLDTTAPATPATVSATDNVGAVQGALGDGGSTDDSTPTFAGSGATQGDIVKVYDGAALLGSTAVKADGSWVFTPAGLGQGVHSITHTITDAAGNTSAASAPLGFAVDTSAVAVSVTKAGETRSGQQITTRPAGSTDDTMPTIVGTATAGAVVSIKEGSTVLASTTADAAGNWNLKLPLQAEGAHSYKATAVNAAGTSSETAFALTIDATPPAVPVIAAISDDVGTVQGALASGAASDDTRPALSGSGATPGDIITVHDNGSAIGSTTVQSDGRWSFTTAAPTAPLGEGEHKLTVTATDPVGNQSQHSAPFVIDVDTTAPARPAAVAGYVDSAGAVQDPASVAPFTDDTTPGFKIASVTAGLTPSLYVDGNKVAATYDTNTGTLTPVSPLGEGAHSISYTLTDAAGNESPRANDFRLTVDLTPPPPPDASSIQVLDNVGAVQGPLAAGAKTDDSKPEYTGKADPAQVSAINVYDNGTLIGSTAVNADGSWRFTPDLPLALGAHSLTARAVDAAGNIGAATPASTFTLVGDPPAAPAIIGVSDDRGSVTGNVPRDASTDDTTLTLSGTGTVGTVVTVYADGVAVGSTSVAPNGTWSVTTSVLSGDGVKNLSAEAVDGAGQASPRTGLYAVVLDTTAPPTPGTVIATDDQGPVQGAIAAGTTTDDTTPTFGGSGVKAGDTVRLYDGGALIGSITAATDGARSITPSTPLGRGAHRITHTVTDAAGNTSAASAALDFTVDPTDVVVSIEQVADDQGSIKGNLAPGARTDDTTPTLVGKATAGAVVTVKEGSTVLDSTTADAGGNWRLTLPAQGEGTHSYTATAVNAAGKHGDATITLAIDTSAPDVPAIAGAGDDVGLVQGAIANGGATDDATPTITGSGATPGDVIKVYDNGSALGSTTVKADGSWSFTPTTPLTEGSHGLRVTAIDPVGNESPQSGSFTVNVDTTPPTTKATLAAIGDDTGSSSGDFVTSDRTLVLTVKVDSAMEAGARVQVSLDNGKTWNDATATGGGSYQYDNTGAALADGSYTFLARVVDAAGNVTPASSQLVVVDNSAPTSGNAVAITAYIDDLAPNTGEYGSGTRTNDTTPVLKGTVSGLKDGDVVQIHEGTTLLGTATVNGSAWTFAVPALTATGIHTYTASIADAAGNKGTTSGDFSLTLSSNPPQQAVTITAYHDDAGLKKGDFGDGTSTDDTTPELRGTLSAAIGATDLVRIYEGSTLLGTATVNGMQWSFALPTLTDGSRHTYVTRIADAAGNEGTASPAFTLSVDTSAPPATAAIASYIDDHDPQQGTFTSGSSTNDTTPLLNGTVTGTLGAGEVVAVYRGGVRLGEATMTGTSTWSYQDAGLVDGPSYSYTVRVEDAAGNGGAASPAFTLTVDLSAPTTAPSIDGATDDAAPTTGAIAPNGTTNDNRPELKGAGAQPNGVVRVYDNDKLIGSTTADSAGKWSFTPEAGKELADGMHSLKASNVDAAGNEGPKSAALEFGIDTVAPSQSATIVSVNDDFGAKQGTVADKGHTDDTAPQVTGTISAALKDGEKVVVLRDGAVIGTATVTNGTSWSFDDAGLSDGRTYTYTVRVEDAGGNRGAISAGYSLTVDTSVPPQTATITTVFDDADPVRGDVANGGTTNDSQPELRGALTAGLGATEVVAVYRDGTKIGTALVSGTSWSYTDTSGLANATSYSYTVRVEDAAGNAGAASSPYVVKLQLSGPGTRTTITAVVDDVDPQQGSVVNDGYTNDTAPQVQGEISAGLQAGEKVAVLRDGKVVGFATMKDATHWTYDDTGLAAGTTYTYTARVQDAASNPGADSNAHAVRVDTSRPAHKVTITRAVDNVDPVSGDIAPNGVTNDDTPTLEGTLSAPLSGTEQLQVFRNGLHAGTAKVTGTSWSFEDAGLASGSTYTYEARVMDAAGNAGDASNSLKFTVNTSGVAQTVQILQVQDNADPAQGKVADGGTTNDTTPTLSGSVSSVLNAGEVVEILRNDVAVGTAVVNGTTWSFTDTGLADGMTYRYTARVVNSGGNQGAKSAAYAITLDTTRPDQSVTITSYTDDKDPREGIFASGTTTNDVAPTLNGTFTGTLGANEVVVVYRDGVRLGSATMIGGSAWSFQDSGLVDGVTYSYTAGVEDAAGNRGTPSGTFSLTVDTTAPEAPTAAAPGYVDDSGKLQNPGTSTSDTTPGLNIGQVPAGQTPSLYVDGTKVPSTYDPATGTLTPSTPLGEGEHKLSHSLSDAAGNESKRSPDIAVTVDTTAPAAPAEAATGYVDDSGKLQAPGTSTSDRTPGLNIGQVPAGQTPSLYVDGTKVPSTYDPATGTLTPSTPLGEGDHKLSYSLSDAAGNESKPSPALALEVDTIAPRQTVTLARAIDDIDPVAGNIPANGTTNDDAPRLEGTLSVVLSGTEQLRVFRNGVHVGNATVTGTSWSFDDSALSNGTTYTYEARVIDAAGNAGAASNSLRFSVNTSAVTQTVEILRVQDNVDPGRGNVTDGSATNDTAPVLSGSISADLGVGDVVQVLRNDTVIGTAKVTGTAWSFADKGLVDGTTYKYTARVVNTGGNQGVQSAGHTITLDLMAPGQTVAITGYTDDRDPRTGSFASGSTTNDTTPQLNGMLIGTLGAGEVVAVYRDGKRLGAAVVNGNAWVFDDKGLADGTTYSYTARVEDAAGNLGAESVAFTLTVDRTPPATAPSIDSAMDNVAPVAGPIASRGTTNDATPELKGSAAEPNGTVHIYDNGTLIGSAVADASGNWTFTPPAGKVLADGAHSLTARNIDAAGNESQASTPMLFTVDTVAPTTAPNIDRAIDDIGPVTGNIARGGTTNDARPELRGTGTEPKGMVNIYDNDTLIGSATADAAGRWSFKPESGKELAEGAHRLTARNVDAAGNEGPTSEPLSFTVDTKTPVTEATITSYTDNVGISQGNHASGTRTDDTTPVLNGVLTAPIGATDTVRIYEGTQLLGTATVSGTQWTFATPTLLSGSTHAYRAVVTDVDGRQGKASPDFKLTVDTSVPTGTIQVKTNSTVDTTPTIDGTVTGMAAGDTIWVKVNGITYKLGDGNLTKPTPTTWSLKIPASDAINVGGATDLKLDVEASIVNAAGGAKSDTTSSELTVFRGLSVMPLPDSDYVATTQPGLLGAGHVGAGESLTVEVYNSQGTKVKTFTGSGTGTGSTGKDGLTFDPATGAWSTVPGNWGSQELAAGTYTVKAFTTVVDGSGGQVAKNVGSFTVVPPVVNANTAINTSNNSLVPRMYSLDDGGYMMLYALEAKKHGFLGTTNYDFYAYRFDATGKPVGSRHTIADTNLAEGASYSSSSLRTYAYDALVKPDGSFSVFYAPGPLVSSISDNYAVVKNFSSSGVQIGEAVRVKAIDASAHIVAPTYVQLDDGRYVVLFSQGDQDAYGMYAYRYSAKGEAQDVKTPLKMDHQLGTGIQGYFYDAYAGVLKVPAGTGITSPSAVQGMDAIDLGGGKYLVQSMETSNGSLAYSPSLTDIVLRVFDYATGAKVLDKQQANVQSAGFQVGSQVIALKGGGFVSVWASNDSSASPGGTGSMDGFDVYARRFDWDGSRIVAKDASESRVNTSTDGVNGVGFVTTETHLGAAALSHGGYVVVWSKFTSLAGSEIYSQGFDAAGNKLGGETLVSTDGTQINILPTVTALRDGGYVVAWTSFMEPGSTLQHYNGIPKNAVIKSMIVNADGTVRGTEDAVASAPASYLSGEGVLRGGDAVDTLDGRKGATEMLGGGGNDYIIVKDTSFTSIDGGSGTDVLAWDSAADLKFADIAAKVSNIEAIHLGDANANTLTLTLQDVLGASSTSDTLVVQGGSSDTLILDTNWSTVGKQTWRGETYQGYMNNLDTSAAIWVQTGIKVKGVATDDQFESTSRNDTFDLSGGGKDTLLYKLLTASSATGGNGVDAVSSFKVGAFETVPDADRIDLKELLVGYTTDADGAAHYVNGVATIDAGETIGRYLSVSVSGGNTTLSIDRDGSGNAYSATPLITLNGVTTDLATLLANHQLVLA